MGTWSVELLESGRSRDTSQSMLELALNLSMGRDGFL